MKKAIKKEFAKFSKGNKKRDDKILINSEKLLKLDQENIIIKRDLRANEKLLNDVLKRGDPISKREVGLMIREALIGVHPAVQTERNTEQTPERHFGDIMIKKARKTRPTILKQAIREHLERGLTTTQTFNIIVTEKRLVGKTQFYHYLSIVKSELRTELRPELRTKPNS